MADADSKKVFDVAKPGKTAPSSSSRPVITGHKMVAKDPMVAKSQPAQEPAKTTEKGTAPEVGEKKDVAAAEGEALFLSSNRIKIMPISHDDEVTTDEDKTTVKTETTPVPEAPQESADTEPAAPLAADEPPEAPAQTDDPPATSDAAAMDAVVGQVDAGNKGKDGEADKAKQEQLEQLIASKEYYLPIDEAKHIHAIERFLAIALIISLLAVAGAYLAVDAGLIKANIDLPVDIIKN